MEKSTADIINYNRQNVSNTKYLIRINIEVNFKTRSTKTRSCVFKIFELTQEQVLGITEGYEREILNTKELDISTPNDLSTMHQIITHQIKDRFNKHKRFRVQLYLATNDTNDDYRTGFIVKEMVIQELQSIRRRLKEEAKKSRD